MLKYSYLQVFLYGLITKNLVSAAYGPSYCYYCDSQFCTDPFDKNLGIIKSCSLIMSFSGRSLDASSNDTDMNVKMKSHESFFDLQTKIWKIFGGMSNDNVCVKANYFTRFGGQNRTLRACLPRSVLGTPICEKISTIYGLKGTVSGCTTCNTDICNSAVSLTSSFLISVITTVMFLKILF